MAEIVTINGKKYLKVLDAETDYCNICALKRECLAAVDKNEETLCDGSYDCHFENIDEDE